MTIQTRVIFAICYLVLCPFIIGLLDGFDRKISARMQGRRGPSVLQPFFDLKKLFEKEFLTANKSQLFMIRSYVCFIILSGILFFAGFDLLLVVFSLSTAAMFLILASTSTHSPYSAQGTHRELVQIMSCEPMVRIEGTRISELDLSHCPNVYYVSCNEDTVVKGVDEQIIERI